MSIRVIVLLGRFQHIQSILIVVIVSDSILELFKISIKLITDFFKMFLSSNCLGFSLINYILLKTRTFKTGYWFKFPFSFRLTRNIGNV